LKHWQLVALIASLVVAALFAGSFLLPAEYQICQPNDYTHAKECAQHHFGPFVVLGIIVILDGHNGLITAIATVFIAAFTIALTRASNRQAALTKEALVTVSRAFVFLENFEPTLSTLNPGSMGATVSDFMFVPRWKNSGDTPTKNLVLRVTYRAISGDLPDSFDYFYQDPPLQLLIGPKSNEWSEPITVPRAEANQALAGSVSLYVWGRADYNDVFAGGAPRFSTFCSRIQFIRRAGQIETNFIAYGPYNRSDADEV
jgi:hypothetical protein